MNVVAALLREASRALACDERAPERAIADYLERRPLLLAAAATIEGCADDLSVHLRDEEGHCLLSLYGLAWGYKGAGPRALALLLCDLMPAVFPDFESAIGYVSTLAPSSDWDLKVPTQQLPPQP